MSSSTNTDLVEIDDPIIESFPIMLDAARRHCRNLCFSYHRLWPYRRRFTGNAGALKRTHYFVDRFRRLARDGKSNRVLVSGNADYGLLAQVLHGFRAEGAEPDVTVLDICEAPLVINRWYAQRQAAKVHTVRSNIVEFTSDMPYGAITTDNFLARIPPAEQVLLLPKWHNLLMEGGKVITTEIALNDDAGSQKKQSNVSIEDRVARFLGRIEDSDLDALGTSLEKLAGYATDYYKAKSSYPLGSLQALRQLFENNGFRIDELSPETLPRRKSQPKRSKNHIRYKVVATRVG